MPINATITSVPDVIGSSIRKPKSSMLGFCKRFTGAIIGAKILKMQDGLKQSQIVE